jgi:predicted peroxiredoxin
MNRLLSSTLLGIAALAALPVSPALAAGSPRLLVLLSASEPEAQGFMLVLANQARGQGAQVDVVLCDTAGDLALRAPSAAASKVVTPNGQSPRSLLEQLIAKGGKAEVCAIYLPNRKITAESLIDGVSIAKPAEVARLMLDPAVRLVSR